MMDSFDPLDDAASKDTHHEEFVEPGRSVGGSTVVRTPKGPGFGWIRFDWERPNGP